MEYYGYLFIFVLMAAFSALVYFSLPCTGTSNQPSSPSIQSESAPAQETKPQKPLEQLKELPQESQAPAPEPVGMVQTSDLYAWDRSEGGN